MLAIVCCVCGRSPIAVGIERRFTASDITDWPPENRITNYYNTDDEGPSVEFITR